MWKFAYQRLKRWLAALPVLVEIFGSAFVAYLIYAGINRSRTIKHSCFQHHFSPVHGNREPPKDHLEDKFFQNPDGLWLHYREWPQASRFKNPKGIIILLHGYSEHIDRHSHIAEFYAKHGYFVLGMDHQGFGRSEGDRAHVESFEHYVDDVIYFIGTFIQQRHPGFQNLPKFLCGHSMGGLITFYAGIRAQDSKNPWLKLDGLVLGNAALGPAPSGGIGPVAAMILHLFAYFRPKGELITFPVTETTNFAAARQHAFFDPLNYNGGFRANTGVELGKAIQGVKKIAHKLRTPTFILHSTKDLLVDVNAVREFYKYIKTKNGEVDIVLHVVPELGHEPLQEELHIRNPILETMVSWIDKHVN